MEDALKFYTRCMEKSQSFPDPCPLLWQLPFLRKNNLVAWKPSLAGPRGKGIGPGISDFGFLVLLGHLPTWVIEIFMKPAVSGGKVPARRGTPQAWAGKLR